MSDKPRTSSRRMLVRMDILANAKTLKELGVPIAVIQRGLGVVMSGLTFSNLLHYYSSPIINHPGNNSLNPEWLDSEGAEIQIPPINYKYVGRFPGGEWVNTDNTDE